MANSNCFHCGKDVNETEVLHFDDKSFCCKGCQTVYEIFSSNGLSSYYEMEFAPGAVPLDNDNKYDFLDNPKIVDGLVEFSEGGIQIVSLQIPHIHCSSCIWILENLRRLQPEITSSQVNFHEKKVRINYNSEKLSLKDVVHLLSAIGYEPYISLDNFENAKTRHDRSLTYKLGVAFFCFGNIMLLSFPEYFEEREFWLDQYRGFFRWLIFALALPSFFYSASGYYVAAYKSIRTKMLNIEIPIALGIVVMFVRSVADILLDHGPGFFDSMSGLVFFMLLGKMFQHKTYKFLDFERDFKSYFPIAVTRIKSDLHEENIPVYEVDKGDRLLIRNLEIIPADGILISDAASIDYSFVTGEAIPVSKVSGDKVFAGGRLAGAAIEIEILQPVSQSYLTQLWSNDAFQKDVNRSYRSITDSLSHYFTPALLLIAFAGLGYWLFFDVNIAFNVFTAVLIVACPCALALTAPFTLGNVLRIFGRAKFYLKNTLAIEQIAAVDTVVFDKTGTITTNAKSTFTYEGNFLSDTEKSWMKNLLRASNHPLSRMLYEHLSNCRNFEVGEFNEIIGQGISGLVDGHQIRIGSPNFTGNTDIRNALQTTVGINIDGIYIGSFALHNEYRPGLQRLFSELSANYTLKVLSGDNEGERTLLQEMLPENVELVFNQKPEEKLRFIKNLQAEGKTVMMVGDGLNDAGALAQSDIGIALSENVNVFSPACDAILDAGEFAKLGRFMKMSKRAIRVIRMSFVLSIAYNIVGLSFAVTGNLLPIVAAIIMPLSTITIISFVTAASNFYSRKLKVGFVPQKGDPSHIFSEKRDLLLALKNNP